MDNNYFDLATDDMKKNNVSDILQEGEKVLLELVPNKKDYIAESILKGLPFALIWGVFDAFFIITIFSQKVDLGLTTWILVGFFALHLIPVWLYFINIFKKLKEYKNIKYVFTDQRIIIRSGIIGIDYKYFFYHDIDSIDVKVGILDRLFHVGDLYIKSKTQSAIIEDIPHPYEYSNKVLNLIKDLKSDLYYPNDYRPKENHGYHTQYKNEKEK